MDDHAAFLRNLVAMAICCPDSRVLCCGECEEILRQADSVISAIKEYGFEISERRCGDVLLAVRDFITRSDEFSRSTIVSVLPYSTKEISNALAYLVRHGSLTRVGYGRYKRDA